jgi:hypothetical protein
MELRYWDMLFLMDGYIYKIYMITSSLIHTITTYQNILKYKTGINSLSFAM